MWNGNIFQTKLWVKPLILFIVTLISLLITNGCFFQQNNTLKTFRVGIINWPGYDIVLYAQEAELFKNRGLEVEFVRFQNNLDASRAMLRGSIDASFSTLWEAKQLDPGNDKPIFVLVTNISYGSDGIVTQSNLKSVTDLKGKKIGARLGTVNHLILLEALNLYNLRPTDVEIDNISNQTAVEKMKQGLLDGAVIWEPLLSKTAQDIQGNIVYTTRDLDSLVIDGLLTRSETLRNKKEEITRFVMTWFDLMEAIDVNPNEVFQVVGQQLDQTLESFTRDYAGLKKGDIAMNQSMFEPQGRLIQALEEIKNLLQEDSRHSRIIREDVEINGDPVISAIEWMANKTK